MKLELKSAAAAALLVVSGVCGAVGVPGQRTWETTLLPRDINGDGAVDAYLDTALNISWQATIGSAIYVTWADALGWAQALDVHGVTGWRLPTAVDDLPTFDNAPGSSEMAHMFFATLANSSFPSPGYGLSNTGPFNQPDVGLLLTSTLATYSASGDLVWAFSTSAAGNVGFNKDGGGGVGGAWAVHDGDVAPPAIPEPGSAVLLLAELAALRLRRQ